MLKNDIYNINTEFDYVTVRSMVLKSLQKTVQEALMNNLTSPMIKAVLRIIITMSSKLPSLLL
jgi:hypothetical protein